MRKVGFTIRDDGRVIYDAAIKGYTAAARASDYVLLSTDARVGSEVLDAEWEIKQAHIDVASSRDGKAGAMKGLLALIRYRREVGGTTLADGSPVPTDRHTQGKLTATVVQVENGTITSVRWKMAAGFVTLTGAEIVAIANTVSSHIAACFDAESTVSDQLDAAPDLDALAAMDLTAEFEAAYQAEIGT